MNIPCATGTSTQKNFKSRSLIAGKNPPDLLQNYLYSPLQPHLAPEHGVIRRDIFNVSKVNQFLHMIMVSRPAGDLRKSHQLRTAYRNWTGICCEVPDVKHCHIQTNMGHRDTIITDDSLIKRGKLRHKH